MRDVSGDSATFRRVAVFGGVYSNHLALRGVLADARARGAERIFCLGDVGGFGPHPDRSVEILRDEGVATVQGNYDHSVGNALEDCGCGYTDPRDNRYARLSYAYTLRKTSDRNRRWLRGLPESLRFRLGTRRALLAHGSPRRVNEFLWRSTTPEPFIRRLLDEFETDLLLVTHTGLHWSRFLQDQPDRGLINVGAIGRPANNGNPAVWYALLEAHEDRGESVRVEMRPIRYDHRALAEEMRGEGLPEEFVETILTGWWTTCLEILPAKERAAGIS